MKNAVRTRCLLPSLLLVSFALPLALHAQTRESALSDAEVEKLRDTSYFPNERVLAFIVFLDDRTGDIHKTITGPRRPGREEDIHDLMEQFTSIADELLDNLDDYAPRHKDIRKALPKLLQATDRWGTILRSPPDNDAYNLVRRLALESLRDIREETTQLIDEQKTWFAAHPPAKDGESKDGRPGGGG